MEELPKINPKDLEEDVNALELDTLLEEMTEELQNKEESIIETVSTQLAEDTNVVVKKDTLIKE